MPAKLVLAIADVPRSVPNLPTSRMKLHLSRKLRLRGSGELDQSSKGPFWPFSRSCVRTDRNACDGCSFIREVGRFGTLLGTCAMAGTNSVDTMTHFANSSGACRQRCHARTICRTSHFTARATPKPLITRKRRRRSRGSTPYQFIRSILIFR